MARAPISGAVIALLAVVVAGCGTNASTSPPVGQEPASASSISTRATTTAPPNAVGGHAPAQASSRILVQLSRLRLPVPTTRSIVFASSSSLILAGGLTSSGTTGRVVRIPFDGRPPTTVGTLAHPVHDAAGVVLGGSMLVLGGGATRQDAWVQRVAAGGERSPIAGHLPATRADAGAVAVGSEAIVVGGGAGGHADPRVLATSDGVHFRVVARLPVAVRYAAVTAVGDRVVVIGGASLTGDVATIQVVDVKAGTAAIVGRLPRTISHATALTIAGSIVVAGGRHAGRALDAVLAIDPTSFAVRTVGRLPRPLSDGAGVVVAGVGYLVGGEAAGPLSTIVTISAL